MAVILGIESTAHTFGIGIVKDENILANIKDAYTTDKGGIIPVEAAKHHDKVKDEVYQKAVKESKIKEEDINAIAFSQGPGLAPCLLRGKNFAVELAKKLKLPIVPVNHCIAHLEIGELTGAKDPVMLYVSGANTQIIAYASGKYRIFGETLDIGVGNFIDTFAREAGIGFPGGPKIQKLAEQGKKYIELPYIVKGMDISLSGILTNLKDKIKKMNVNNKLNIKLAINEKSDITDRSNINLIADKSLRNNKKNSHFYINNLDNIRASDSERIQLDYTLADLSYSLQETVFAMLVETAERALAHTGKKELLLGGGVACNTRLQEMCKIMSKERIEKTKCFCPENSLLVDNGAMIAYLGERMFNKKIFISKKEIENIDFKPYQRTDDIEVNWK